METIFAETIRKIISSKFSGKSEIRFRNIIPAANLIAQNIRELNQIGLYLHIPFCNQICPYCPYNKEIFKEETVREYVKAVKKEIEFYARQLSDKPITTFYIGGGTPTTMLGKGLEEIVSSIYKHFNMQCPIHMESHPNHIIRDNLDRIEAMGVKYLSMGVEALQDDHLRLLERPYNVADAKHAIEKALERNFECVNIDYIFDLPGQTKSQIEQAAKDIVKLSVTQAATYPMFRFPYTRFGKEYPQKNQNAIATMFRRRKFLKAIEDIFYGAGYERSSVWAFTKKRVDKYCSVTVPSYIGLGASGSSYLKNIFYLNTFNVAEYNKVLLSGNSPVALSVNLEEKAQMAGWLYWRIYETRFRKSDFETRFNCSFDSVYGKFMKSLEYLGFSINGDDCIELTDKGAYWIHAFEDFFSIDYINKLWGTSRTNPWPESIKL